MSQVLITRTILKAIADQIRDKLDIPQKIAVCDMPDRISEIEGINVDRRLQTFATYVNSTAPQSAIREGRYANFNDGRVMVMPLDPLALTPLIMDYTIPWEIGVRFRFKEAPTSKQTMAGSYNGYYKSPNIELNDFDRYSIWLGYSTSGSRWDVQKTISTGEQLELDKWYFVKAGWTGIEGYLAITDDFETYHTESWEQETPAYSGTDSLPIFGMSNNRYNICTKTEIDLDNTYIKSDGVLIWGAERFSGGE